VSELYTRTLVGLVASAEVFKWNSLEWADDDIEQLARVLLLARSLREMWINYNDAVGDRAAIALAAAGAAGGMPSLVYLDIDRNSIGDRGINALGSAVEKGAWPNLERFAYVRGNAFTRGGAPSTSLKAACKRRGIEVFDGIAT
jgi:hypothetical protein